MSENRYSWFKELRLLGKLFQLETATGTMRARRICEAYDFMLLTDRTRYLNFGYWAPGCDSYDDACEALVDLLGKAAGLGSGDRVLDAGFGYGDQVFRWLDTTDVARVVGINITPLHVREATRRARELGLHDRAEFLEGSATELPFEAESFDKVVSLESPVQFVTRRVFLEQSYHVLRPGGVFAAAEILPLATDTDGGGASSGTGEGVGWFNSTPKDNWHTAQEYGRRLREIGFVDVRLESIRDHVWEPWRRYMANRVDTPEFRARISRLAYRTYRKQLLGAGDVKGSDQPMTRNDYVLVVARKPQRVAA